LEITPIFGAAARVAGHGTDLDDRRSYTFRHFLGEQLDH